MPPLADRAADSAGAGRMIRAVNHIKISLPTLLAGAIAAAMVIQMLTPDSVLRGDYLFFRDHADRMLDGQLPYIDFDFEHFPIAALPMLLAGAGDRWIPGLNFVGGFVALAALAIVGVAFTVRAIGRELEDDLAAPRWAAITAPMFPFLLYRVDPLSVLFAALAFLGLLRARPGLYLASASLGIATKGWPALFAVLDWLRDRKRRAVILAGVAAAIGLILLTLPGFRSGRSFDGVHLETLSGSLTLFFRLLGDTPHRIASNAGALYIGVGSWALLVNAAIGLMVWTATLRVRRTDQATMTLLVVGLLLASPLLSAQFLMWVTPFLAVVRSRAAHVLMATLGAISTLLLAWWEPTNLGWATLLVVRNLTLLGLGAYLLRLGTKESPAQAGSNSLRNLPV